MTKPKPKPVEPESPPLEPVQEPAVSVEPIQEPAPPKPPKPPSELDNIRAEMKEISQGLRALKENDLDEYYKQYNRLLKLAGERDRLQAAR